MSYRKNQQEWWRENPPGAVRAACARVGIGLDEAAVCLESDLDENSGFGSRWLVMTSSRLAVFDPRGEAARDMPLDSVSALNVENLVGGGLLCAQTAGGFAPLVRFSAARAIVFGLLARAFPDFKREGRVSVRADHAPARCRRCGCALRPHETVCPRCVAKGAALSRLWGYAKPFKTRLALVAAILMFGAVGSVLPFGLWKVFIDYVFNAENPRPAWLPWMVLTYAVSGLVESGMRTLLQWHSVYIGQNLTYRIRGDLFRHVISMGLPFFDKFQAGELMSRIDHDTGHLEHILVEIAQFVCRNLVLVAVMLATMMFINARLALIALIPVPLIIGGSALMARYVMPRFHQLRRRHARMSARLNAALSGIRLVKAMGREPYEDGRFGRLSGEFRDSGLALGRTFAVMFPLIGMGMQLGVWLTWLLGGRQVLDGAISRAPVGMTLGDLLAFIGILGMFYHPFIELMHVARWATDGLAAAQRVFDILDSDRIGPGPGSIPMPEIQGAISFENAVFGYEPLKPVLRDFNLDVKPGEMIGLVGHSGAGKTTTTNLLLRFYALEQGRILVDGVNILDIAEKDLRRQVAAVPQEPYLFAGSVAENIAYGDETASLEKTLASAIAANAHDFIMDMPDAYDSAVGEGGGRLSGGERQRLTIARAIARDPRILILDEATSSVDTDTERRIRSALEKLVRNRTTFAIAHRLSTLRNADRLVVLKDGRILEMGTHEELMSKGGEYRRLVKLQTEMSHIKAV